jgi:DNA-binding GntR family transcriptional regulator
MPVGRSSTAPTGEAADSEGGRNPAAAELSTSVVHDRLRAAILRGEFEPNVPISQVQLAARLGVSRTPLREALRMLQREGLIDSEPNRRVRVAALTVSQLEELYAARILIDCLAARLAVPRLTAEDLAEMQHLLAGMAAHSNDLHAWDVRHRAFHDLFKTKCGDRLARIGRDLFDHTERYRHVYLAEPRAWTTAGRDHAGIYKACRAGEPVAASTQLARHLGRTALAVIALADPEHDPVPVREALRMVTGVPELPEG